MIIKKVEESPTYRFLYLSAVENVIPMKFLTFDLDLLSKV